MEGLEGCDSVIIKKEELSKADEYFESYEDFTVHRLMLDDRPRTEAYQKAILASNLFKNKIVMDVGAGTGILTLFCVQAGAKKVFAVEASKMAQVALENCKENNAENIVEVLHSKVEDLPSDIKVDIIVSEWMGFYLLHESMIDSVFYARDKHLKEGGKLFPEYATLSCALCSAPSLFHDWDSVYSFKMSSMKNLERQSLMTKPQVETLKEDDVLSTSRNILTIDMNTATVEDISNINSKVFISTFRPGIYQGVGLWFDVTFPEPEELDEDQEPTEIVQLDTSPFSEPTHWKQTVILWPEDRLVEEGDVLGFELSLSRSTPQSRSYTIQLTELDPATEPHPVPCECGSAKCDVIRAFLENCEGSDDEDMLSAQD